MKKFVLMLVCEKEGKEVVKAFSGLALLSEYVSENKVVVKKVYKMDLNK